LNGDRRLVDVRNELHALLYAEMSSRYFAQVTFQASAWRRLRWRRGV
jgi:hypothetical protein